MENEVMDEETARLMAQIKADHEKAKAEERLLKEQNNPVKEPRAPKPEKVKRGRGRPRVEKPPKVKGKPGRPVGWRKPVVKDEAYYKAKRSEEHERYYEKKKAKNLAAGLTVTGLIDKSKLPEDVRLAEVVEHDEFLPDRVVNDRTMYARKLHGIVYDPQNTASLARMKKHIRAFFALQMNEQEVADAMNVRLDVLRSWLKRFPELQNAKEYGMMDLKADLMNATFRRAMGYDYYEECATRNGPQKVLKHMPGDPRLLQWLDCNIFKGKLAHMVDQQQASSINIQIVNAERNA